MALISRTGFFTPAQRHAATGLIPGAYEPNAASAPRSQAAVATAPYVVDAPTGPTTFLGRVAAILGDLGLIAAVVLVGAAVPALAIWGIYLAGAFVLDIVGRR